MTTITQHADRLRGAQQGGFDVTTVIAADLVNRAIRRLAIRSRSVVVERELGPGVAGQYQYVLDDDIVDLHAMIVNGDPKFYRTGTIAFFSLVNGDAFVPSGKSGAFAPRWADDGNARVGIYPAPGTGDSLIGLAAISTPDYAGSDVSPLPLDLDDAVQWAAKGIAYEEVDEDPNTAAYYFSKADTAAAELGERVRGRVGSGAIQGQIRGVHFW